MRRRFLFLLCLVLIVGLGGCLFFRRTTGSSSQPNAGGDAKRSTGIHSPATSNSAGATGKSSPPSDKVFDFVDALEAARTLQDPADRMLQWGKLIRRWIEHDLEAALAYVRQLPPGDETTQALVLVLEAIGHQDPERCLVLAGELAVTREQQAIYSSLFAQMVESDPAVAALRLVLVPPGEGRENAVRALADGWARADFAAAYRWAQTLEGAERSQAIESTLSALTFNDPLRAIELAQQSLHGPPLNRTLMFALQSLTLSDSTAAAAIVTLLPAGEVQATAALDVARELAAKDVVQALSWVQSLPEGDAQRMALNNILMVWATKDPAAASQYVAQMNPGSGQAVAAKQMARILGAGDPLNALAWATALPAGSTRATALLHTVSAWAERDPAAAASWAATQAPDTLRIEALKGALSYWLLQDAAAAGNFVSGLAGEAQFHAAVSIAPSLAQTDPSAALRWTQTLATPIAREEATTAAYARWADNAPREARLWLERANLAPEVKARLRQGK